MPFGTSWMTTVDKSVTIGMEKNAVPDVKGESAVVLVGRKIALVEFIVVLVVDVAMDLEMIGLDA